jgi:hypothetical protein
MRCACWQLQQARCFRAHTMGRLVCGDVDTEERRPGVQTSEVRKDACYMSSSVPHQVFSTRNSILDIRIPMLGD